MEPPALPESLENELLELLSSDGEQRTAGLDDLCRRFPVHAGQLRANLERFLIVNRALAGRGGEPLQQVGDYRILGVLGEGGMGTVYLAEQKQPMRRRVALKVIKLGMDSKQVLARFEAERQALAMMEHSNIAKVFEAGTTERGQPYFVMEYVRGIPITDYCDQSKLTIAERLALFSQVCSGVQHAHLKGVMHRDLKPANVLVSLQDGKPMPKIIDFGLARATDHRLVQATIFTQQGMVIGTPEYMSPEQANLDGLDVDTRTDVYALGVMLYELLVGQLPFSAQELRQAGLVEIQRRIREDDPHKPSTKVTTLGEASTLHAKLRRTDVRTLVRQLRGELDWVVMKALEKDRTRRYQSAAELAADLDRHLNDQPVSAGPPGLTYLTVKLLKRRRGVLALTLLAVALLLALAFVWSSMRRVSTLEQRQHVLDLLATGWTAEGPRPELRALYDDYFARLKRGATSAEENDLFLGKAVKTTLKTRRICAPDSGIPATVEVCGNIGLRERGLFLRVSVDLHVNGEKTGDSLTTNCYLAEGKVETIKTWRALNSIPSGRASSSIRLEARTALHLRAVEAEDIRIWTWRQTDSQEVEVVAKLPDDYPVAVKDATTAELVEAGFVPTTIGTGIGYVRLSYSYQAPVPLSGRLEILPLDRDTVVTAFDMTTSLRYVNGSIAVTTTASPDWSKFCEDVQGGTITTARIRYVPDRRVALSEAGVEIYYGRSIERVLPVAPVQ